MRCEHHTPQPDDDAAICSACGSYVWASPRAIVYRKARPLVPLLCCMCSSLRMETLTRMFPHIAFQQADIPDLSRLIDRTRND